MIHQISQVRMRARLEVVNRWRWAISAAAALLVTLAGPVEAQPQARDAKARERAEETQRQEGEAILAIADAAMAGKAIASDFAVRWHNDFLKAQQGTFVPFTLTIDTAGMRSSNALAYVRAVSRTGTERRRDKPKEEPDGGYPVDAIFPVTLRPEGGGQARINRGFSLAPGEYDVYVVVRERVDPEAAGKVAPRAALIRQMLTVPDFWSGELTTSTVILADRLETLPEPIPPDELAERPYVIGQNDVTPAADRTFGRNEELIVVFLVYSPTVAADKKFDLQVEYHFYLKGGRDVTPWPSVQTPHPPEREGERYYNHTDPQRFNPAVLGSQFDAVAHPVMAGQGVPLAGFPVGDYRLVIRVTDLLAGTSILRDVLFTVGS